MMNGNDRSFQSSVSLIIGAMIAAAVIMRIFMPSEPYTKNNKPESLSESVPHETYVHYTSPPAEPPSTAPAGFYPDNRDVYCVGAEYAPREYYMAEGIYMLIADSGSHDAYFQKIGADEENWQEIKDSKFQYSCIVKLEKGWDFMPSHCDAYSLEYFDSLDMENNPFEHSGMFRVGTDVQAGTYKIVPSDEQKSPLWTVHRNIDSIDYDKIYYDEHDEDEITLKDGEILEMHYCRLEKNS